MGLLDQVLGSVTGGQPQAVRRPGMGGTIAAGVLLALLVKAVRSSESTHGVDENRSFDPSNRPAAPPTTAAEGGLGGLLGGLGGMLGGGGLGNILGNLGGAGALGGLIGQLRQRGFGQQADSWVTHGTNEPIAPAQLPAALGEDTIQTLQQQTGMPRDALLAELAHLLPQAVDEVTPEGRPPTDEELHQIARQPPSAPRS
jgi:uncharacterized protein YidB (DUF937 family)